MALRVSRPGASARVTTPAGAAERCSGGARRGGEVGEASGGARPRRRPGRALGLPLRVAVGLCLVVGALAGAGSAHGASGHPFLGSFGPEGPHSLTSFVDVQAVTVDAAGNVYVYDNRGEGEEASVYKFNAQGEPVDFTSTGTNVIEKIGEHTHYPAVDELAVSPAGETRGDLYVESYGSVGIYSSETGEKVGELNSEVEKLGLGAPEWRTACGVAVDPEGRVYVGLESHNVNMYTPTGRHVDNADYTSSLWSLPGESCNLAVDSEEHVYVDTWSAGPVTEYDTSELNASGLPPLFGQVVDTEGSTLAASPSPAGPTLYVDEQHAIAEYDTSGEPARITTLGESEPGKLGGASFGVGSSVAGEIYASSGAGQIDIYGPIALEGPSLTTEFVTDVTEATATVHAQVNPELFDTHYYVQWGTESCAGHPGACADTPASPGVDIGSGRRNKDESTELRGLTPGTLYHFRWIASNERGTVEGPEHSFTTTPVSAPLKLPDGRAWEMVSPVEKNGAHIVGIYGSEFQLGSGALMQTSPNGNAVAYIAIGAFGDARGASRGSNYIATRGPDGWSTQDVTPPQVSTSYGTVGHSTPYKAFSEDLSAGLLINGDFRPVENPSLAPNMPAGYQNFYLHSFGDEKFQALLTGAAPEETPERFSLELEGASPDLSHVVLSSEAALTKGTVDREDEKSRNLYEWANGQLEPVNVLPGGEPAPSAVVGSGYFEGHTVSDSGARVFWSRLEGARLAALYVHEVGAPTVEVDASKIGGEGGEGTFLTASNDGSRMFFEDRLKLTNESTARGYGSDIYLYDVNTRQLTDITVDNDPVDENGADVQGVLGASADGSLLYFVAKGDLAGGGVSGENNLYVWHEGETKFIATLVSEDESSEATAPGIAYDWSRSIGRRTARVSPSGESAVFMSAASLTGYDNTDLLTGKRDEEVYLYDAGSGTLRCVSCNPTGGRPLGPTGIPPGTHFGDAGGEGASLYQPRVLSEDGHRVFFETYDALVPQDTNGQLDVYEYEAPGSGSCTSVSETFSERSGGCVSLISGGLSGEESSFMDASADGSDVFFVTSQPLVAQDTDTLADLYDARENGGFPATSSLECAGTSCQGVPAPPPTFATPPSATFSGIGNYLPPAAAKVVSKKKTACPRGRVRRRGRCVTLKAKRRGRSKARRTGARRVKGGPKR